jgi:hypothetical protein
VSESHPSGDPSSSGGYGDQPATATNQPTYGQPGPGQSGGYGEHGGYGEQSGYAPQGGYGAPGGYAQQAYGAPGQGGYASPGGYSGSAPGQSYGGYGSPPASSAPGQAPGQAYGGSGASPGYAGYGASPYSPAAGSSRSSSLGNASTVATILTIVGYALAGLSVLTFILILVTNFGYGGSGVYKFAQALLALITGFGFGALSLGLGTLIRQRASS